MSDDDIDRAAEQYQVQLDAAIQARRVVPKRTGRCLWCDEAALPNASFCSADCRETYEMSEKMKAITGRA